jgi:AbrB family looped-hinge helix DNA binding protein
LHFRCHCGIKWHIIPYMAHDTKITWTKVDSQGRVVIPAEVRQRMGIEPNKPIAFVEEDGQVGLMTVTQGIRRAQAIAARVIKREPGRSLVDEFIAERRAEAARE